MQGTFSAELSRTAFTFKKCAMGVAKAKAVAKTKAWVAMQNDYDCPNAD